MGCDLLRLLYCQERWRSISVAHFFAVIHSRLQQILCELWFVNAVDVRLRVLLHLSIVHLIADPTVNQRSVISESTFSRVWIFSSFRASGGFQVKAMKRITHTKSTVDLRFVQTLEEEKNAFDGLVRVNMLYSHFNAFPVVFGKFADILLSLRVQKHSSTDQHEEQKHGHLYPVRKPPSSIVNFREMQTLRGCAEIKSIRGSGK